MTFDIVMEGSYLIYLTWAALEAECASGLHVHVHVCSQMRGEFFLYRLVPRPSLLHTNTCNFTYDLHLPKPEVIHRIIFTEEREPGVRLVAVYEGEPL